MCNQGGVFSSEIRTFCRRGEVSCADFVNIGKLFMPGARCAVKEDRVTECLYRRVQVCRGSATYI